jgi:hypothetical protein
MPAGKRSAAWKGFSAIGLLGFVFIFIRLAPLRVFMRWLLEAI